MKKAHYHLKEKTKSFNLLSKGIVIYVNKA